MRVKPHLHILVKSDEVNKIALKTVENINKRYRKRNPNSRKSVVARRYPVTDENKYISYVMQQGTAKRFIYYDHKRILSNLDLKQYIRDTSQCFLKIFIVDKSKVVFN